MEETKHCSVTSKICYSQREANLRIHSAKNRKRKHGPKKIPQRAYFCKYCGMYHLTHLRSLHTTKATLRRYGPKGDREF